MGADDSSTLGFETDIKPLFREKDRQAMRRAFDLWSYDDVVAHADAITQRLSDGTMPCDDAWPYEQGSVSSAGSKRAPPSSTEAVLAATIGGPVPTAEPSRDRDSIP